jgi:WD40 repeat protein
MKHSRDVVYADFSPDGGTVVTTSHDATARLWDARTGAPLAPPLTHQNVVGHAAFSPDGRWVATGSRDGTARIWDTKTGQPVTPPLRHGGHGRKVQFHPDGARLLIAGAGGDCAQVWDVRLDPRAADDLASLAELLSGRRIDVTGGFVPLEGSPWTSTSTNLFEVLRSKLLLGSPKQPDDAFGIWTRLQAKYPEAFTVPDAQVGAWHQRQASSSEKARDWFAAAFHLDRLSAAKPKDESIQRRLMEVRRRLEKSE